MSVINIDGININQNFPQKFSEEVSYEIKLYRENFNFSTQYLSYITGFEDYLGRKCAVISGTSDIKIQYESSSDEEDFDICTCEFTISIDYETGIWMKSDIKHTNYDLAHYISTITDIAFADDAKSPMSKDEFKQSALNDCVKRVYNENEQTCTIEAVNESDLAFLD